MKRSKILAGLIGIGALFVVLGFVGVAPARAELCEGSSFCNCPCNVPCSGAEACSEVRQVCQSTFVCGGQIPGNCAQDPGPYECMTCNICSDTYEFCQCAPWVNPCINICDPDTTPTPAPTSTPGPSCGNGTCSASTENCSTCPSDCGACPVVPAPAGCGNGVCDAGETCGSCGADCGTCTTPPTLPPGCWDSICNNGENCSTCPFDCGQCPNGTLRARASKVTTDASCAAIRASTEYVDGTIFSFTPSSTSQPPPQTQASGQFIEWTNVISGIYLLSPSSSEGYVLQRTCWANENAITGEGLVGSLNSNGMVVWNVGYHYGTPWVQTQGGNVYGAGIVRSYIPSGASPRVFSLTGSGGYPGVAIYGTSYDFDSDPTLTGGTFVSSKNWLVNETRASINYYDYFWRKLGGGTTVDSFADLGAVARPTSRATPYYVVGDMTTSGDWTVADGETIIFIVNGNLTIGGKVNLTGSGFAAFIVNGNISVSSSVGGLYTSSTPVIEGIYVTSPTGTIKTGTSTVVGKERLVAKGIFVGGGFLLQRDLDSVDANPTTSSELFIYNPRLLFTMPDSMRDVPITWAEVAP